MNHRRRTAHLSLTYALLASFTVLQAAEKNEASDKADLEQLVAETHQASLKLREEALARPSPKTRPGPWASGATTSGPSRPSI